MKSLVIGGNGFIGTNLIDGLLNKGHSVRVFDRYPNRFREPNPAVEYVVGDLGNYAEVANVVRGIDYVYHLAYTSLPHTSNEDPIYDIRSNVVDTVQMLHLCSLAAIRKIIFASSGGTVYGIPQKTPISEDDATQPICSYGITKLTIEKYLRLFHRLHGLDYVVARISNPYGELQNPNAMQGAVTVFLGNLLRGKPITVWGDGEIVRDYIYIGDTVRALIMSAEFHPSDTQHRVFNIGAGQGYTLNQITAAVRGVTGHDFEVLYTLGRLEDVPSNVLDISRAESELGWKPEVALDEGLLRTWNWLRTIQL